MKMPVCKIFAYKHFFCENCDLGFKFSRGKSFNKKRIISEAKWIQVYEILGALHEN